MSEDIRYFKLKKDQEFIVLTSLLKAADLCSTGGEAKIRIVEGEVLLNGETETRKKKKIYVDDRVELDGNVVVVQAFSE